MNAKPQTLTIAGALERFSRALELLQWDGGRLIAVMYDRTKLSTRQRADICALSIAYDFRVRFV